MRFFIYVRFWDLKGKMYLLLKVIFLRFAVEDRRIRHKMSVSWSRSVEVYVFQRLTCRKPSDLEHACQYSHNAQKVNSHLAQADLIHSELLVFFLIMQDEK